MKTHLGDSLWSLVSVYLPADKTRLPGRGSLGPCNILCNSKYSIQEPKNQNQGEEIHSCWWEYLPSAPGPCSLHTCCSFRVLCIDHVLGAVCKCSWIDHCFKHACRIPPETSFISLDPDVKKDREPTGWKADLGSVTCVLESDVFLLLCSLNHHVYIFTP